MQACSSSRFVCSPRVAAGLAASSRRPLAARPLPLEQRKKSSTALPRAAPEGASSDTTPSSSSSSSAAAAAAAEAEEVLYEGSGANAELALSLLLGALIITLPLTIASVGRRLWIRYRFTNRRLVVITDSPLLKREVQVEYKQIKEIRSAPRAFGAWGDIVFFLKDGSRLELAGLERYDEIVKYIEQRMS